MKWMGIKDNPVPEDTEILIGHYYVDTSDGYSGESQWLWITQTSLEDGEFSDNFNDDFIKEEHMVYWNTITHWSHMPEPPE